ncbi:hypothetical protein NA56DRAFT_181766 [Hyaloscypha hepaticicola]|uniref:Uncharacterized protein n=1 Tax=Hyaloscypha hepaticicola TaxID=2082293 RepID=A0A2J6Q2K7_9HELO|nr:hypothetical protein NA56DRAFT_181766 [Hyaloscypha hepaticicola]
MMCERSLKAPPSLQQLHITITLIIAVNITSKISSSLSAHIGTNKVAFRPEPSPHPPSDHSQLQVYSIDLQRAQCIHPILQHVCGNSDATLSHPVGYIQRRMWTFDSTRFSSKLFMPTSQATQRYVQKFCKHGTIKDYCAWNTRARIWATAASQICNESMRLWIMSTDC